MANLGFPIAQSNTSFDTTKFDSSTLDEPNERYDKVITIAKMDTDSHDSVKPRVNKKSHPSRTAVLDLLQQSQAAIEDNDYRTAESILNRALRIEPSNAWLWHNMAIIKFYQEDYQQAIQQALKSNNLEKNDKRLSRSNAQIIKQSQQQLSDG